MSTKTSSTYGEASNVLSLKADENQKQKKKLGCTAITEPCVQLCLRRKVMSGFWSLNCTHKHLDLNHPSFWLCWRAGVGLEGKISENGTAIFGRTGPTGQRGPPLEVDHFGIMGSTLKYRGNIHDQRLWQVFPLGMWNKRKFVYLRN